MGYGYSYGCCCGCPSSPCIDCETLPTKWRLGSDDIPDVDCCTEMFGGDKLLEHVEESPFLYWGMNSFVCGVGESGEELGGFAFMYCAGGGTPPTTIEATEITVVSRRGNILATSVYRSPENFTCMCRNTFTFNGTTVVPNDPESPPFLFCGSLPQTIWIEPYIEEEAP